jgi:hypothetical protein
MFRPGSTRAHAVSNASACPFGIRIFLVIGYFDPRLARFSLTTMPP